MQKVSVWALSRGLSGQNKNPDLNLSLPVADSKGKGGCMRSPLSHFNNPCQHCLLVNGFCPSKEIWGFFKFVTF